MPYCWSIFGMGSRAGHVSSLCPCFPQLKQIIWSPSYCIFQILLFRRNFDNEDLARSTFTHSRVNYPLSMFVVVLSSFNTLPILLPILLSRKCLLKYSTPSFGIRTHAVSFVILSSSGTKLGTHSLITK